MMKLSSRILLADKNQKTKTVREQKFPNSLYLRKKEKYMGTKDKDNHVEKLQQFEFVEDSISSIRSYDYLIPNGLQDQTITENKDRLVNYQEQLDTLIMQQKDMEAKAEQTKDSAESKSIKNQLVEVKSEIEDEKDKIRKAEEEIIRQTEHLLAELECLKEATRYSENIFAADIEDCSNNVCSLDDSPCTEAFIDYMRTHCFNIDDIISHFDSAIKKIEENHMDSLEDVNGISDRYLNDDLTECYSYLR